MTKGIAIVLMVLLHLFCRKTDLPYETLLKIGKIPLSYYIGLFGDACVPIYCFCSGYGLYLSYFNNKNTYFINSRLRLSKLLVNFWMILLLFGMISILIGNGSQYPGTLQKFCLTFFLVAPAYNGAWWFLTTYLFLVITSPIVNKLIQKNHWIKILFIAGIIYFISYLIRFKYPDIGSNNALFSWILGQAALYGTSVFPFVIGGVFAKENFIEK